jgi:Kef-type K+ transport system membrane component KefB
VGVFITTFFDHNKELEHKLTPFGFGFLITIFFVHVGSSLNLGIISFDMILNALLISLLMIFVRVVASVVFYKNLSRYDMVLFGFSLSMPLTLLIATATIAHQNKFITDYWFNVLVFTAVLEVLIVMLGVKYIENKKIKKDDNGSN